MHKAFEVRGHGVNLLGLTMNLCYTLTTTSEARAREMAAWVADAGGYTHVCITSVEEVAHA